MVGASLLGKEQTCPRCCCGSSRWSCARTDGSHAPPGPTLPRGPSPAIGGAERPDEPNRPGRCLPRVGTAPLAGTPRHWQPARSARLSFRGARDRRRRPPRTDTARHLVRTAAPSRIPGARRARDPRSAPACAPQRRRGGRDWTSAREARCACGARGSARAGRDRGGEGRFLAHVDDRRPRSRAGGRSPAVTSPGTERGFPPCSDPRASDLLARGEPHPVEPLRVVDEPVERAQAARPSDHPTVQPTDIIRGWRSDSVYSTSNESRR